MTTEARPGHWPEPQSILVILAHPDDPEFFCGATLARWARAGHRITYHLLTCGDKGFNDSTPPDMTPDDLCRIRHEEQQAAAREIGVEAVHFLDRAEVVLDAVFPAAGNKSYFPELLVEGYGPHMPREVWVSLTEQPNVTLDVTDTWPVKLRALLQHKTQIREEKAFIERMRARHTEDSTDEAPRYEEKFRVIKYG